MITALEHYMYDLFYT